MLAVSGPIAYGIVAENMPQKDVKVCFLGTYCVGKTSMTKRFVKDRFDEEYTSTIGAAFLSRSLYSQNIEYRFALWDTAGQERTPRVGKTSITKRFVKGRFDEEYISSVGAAFLSRLLYFQDIEYSFALWDTAGQEQFRSLAPLTYMSAAAALIVYDITNQDSFDDIDFWISELRREGPEEILIYVVGNKVDLESYRVVDRAVAESYAQTKGVLHFHSSAKTGQGVEEIFQHICQMQRSIQENGCRNRQSTVDVSNSTNSDGNREGDRGRCRCQSK